MISISFDPSSATDVVRARAMFDALTVRLPDTQDSDVTEIPTKVADDLLSRLGERGRELLVIASEFDRPFSLMDLVEKTGGSISQMKSRWANLGRSIAATRARFGNIVIFQEQVPAPNGEGYFTFVMHAGVRKVVLQRKK